MWCNPPVDLDDPRVLIRNGREPSLTDPMFHQQMVYAVCTSIYNVFREALGRDPSWGFAARPGEERPVLRIRPHAFNGQNAFYDPRPGELNFGFFDAETAEGRNLPHGRVFTCLSHDIVAHEMTHALLDGMRARFRLTTNPDVLAFHEGFADLVAIFLHFSYQGGGAGGDRALERYASDGWPAAVCGAAVRSDHDADRPVRSVAERYR